MTFAKYQDAIYRKLFSKYIRHKTGAKCVFIPLNKTVGIKLYTDADNRNFAHRNQKRARKFAPKTGEKFDLVVNTLQDNDEAGLIRYWYYGYFTEVAKPIRCLSEKDQDRLSKNLENIGLTGDDLFEGNCGRINGKVVVIDFDKGSCLL